MTDIYHLCTEIVEAVAEGDLTVAVNEKELRVRDEVGDIDRAIANLQKRLSDIVSDIHEMCKNVNSASQSLSGHAETSSAHLAQIDTAVNEIAQGAGTQAEETQETTENVIVMGDMIEKNNSQIENLNVNAEEMTKAGDSAIDTLKELEAINGKTKNAIEVIYEQTNTTNESAMKIREAINLIYLSRAWTAARSERPPTVAAPARRVPMYTGTRYPSGTRRAERASPSATEYPGTDTAYRAM